MKRYICLALCLFIISSTFISCSNYTENNYSSTAEQDSSKSPETTSNTRVDTDEFDYSSEHEEDATENELTTSQPADTEEPEEIIYEDNESIQKFITKYNKMYPDSPIKKDMITKYHHHGRDHDDQIKFYLDGYSITLSDTTGYFSSSGYEASVYIDNKGDSNDGIKALFFKFMRVYDDTLSDDTLEQYWAQQTESYSNNDTFNGIECYTVAGENNHIARYTKIDGKFLDK